MMGMPWFRQGNKYYIRLSVRVDVNTKSKQTQTMKSSHWQPKR